MLTKEQEYKKTEENLWSILDREIEQACNQGYRKLTWQVPEPFLNEFVQRLLNQGYEVRTYNDSYLTIDWSNK